MATIPAWIFDGSPIPDPFGHGERAIQFLRAMKHPKNSAPGHPFELSLFQERVIRRLEGDRHTVDDPDLGIRAGDRKFRRAFLGLPRGNRKTALCGALALLALRGPNRTPGSVVVSAAGAVEQARELFNEVKLIVEHDPRLGRHMRVKTTNASITYPKASTTYRAVSANGRVQHGKTPSLIIADELHIWKGTAGRELWDSLRSATSKIKNTVFVVATTAGAGQENLAYEQWDYALKVQRGEIIDPSFLPIIFAADKDDDWRDPELWKLVNPGMRDGYPDIGGFHADLALAERSASDRTRFQQYNLNMWQEESTSPFVDMKVYDEGAAAFDAELLERLKGEPCYVGVDLSISDDLTAIVAAWRDPDDEEGFIVRPWFFLPEETIEKHDKSDGVPYGAWVKDGLVEAIPGPVVDQKRIAEVLRELCETYAVQEIAYDPARASLLMTALGEEGLPVLRFDQSWRLMAPAADALKRAIVGRHFRHGGNAVLRWNFENVVVVRDRNDNIAMHKGKSKKRIDGAVAAAMAVARAAANEVTSNPLNSPDCDPASWFA
ncbi:terminase large subunit [Aureimonas psammosilenae]|uniref:terminase large subunit n=1 Tax=Aureimonas psammosilenae TaxID=2495496 RepID=UPI001260BAEA|nr:terminase TerL endonuclease subunit [Aureimonas psammosilenae]